MQIGKFEEILKTIPLIYTSGPKNPVQQRNVAHLKRFLECYLNDPDFRQKFDCNPQKALDDNGIKTDPAAARILIDSEAAKICEENPEAVPLEVKQFYAFFAEKIQWRNDCQAKYCVPDNPNFKKWRQRQVNRCWGELGENNISFIHVPLIFELAVGCSVGCPFCALSAKRLEKVFRADDENTALWRDVLNISKEIIGAAAGEGVCYFATEPLDNPDYEVFAGIYREILGKTPQITTAVAMRNPERTRKILEDSLTGNPIIHRFSILSLETFRAVCRYFTPEELLYVELLPRYEGSLTNIMTKAGRLHEHGNEVNLQDDFGNTISCASGFVVNMAEKSIRLTAPCNADDEHPTGEIQSARYYFKDADGFRSLLLQIIRTEMPLSLDMQKTLGFQKFYRYEECEDGFWLRGVSTFVFKLKDAAQPHFYKEVGRMLCKGSMTGREIAWETSRVTGADIASVFNFLRYLDSAGALLY